MGILCTLRDTFENHQIRLIGKRFELARETQSSRVERCDQRVVAALVVRVAEPPRNPRYHVPQCEVRHEGWKAEVETHKHGRVRLLRRSFHGAADHSHIVQLPADLYVF